MNTLTICKGCELPLDIMPTQGAYKRINGEYVATEVFLQGTCRTHGCRRHNITLKLEALAALTEEQIKSYERAREGMVK